MATVPTFPFVLGKPTSLMLSLHALFACIALSRPSSSASRQLTTSEALEG